MKRPSLLCLIVSPRRWSKRYLEPIVEKFFHPDSYGYRPGKSAIEAVGVARQRCWRRTGPYISTSLVVLTT